MTDICKRNGIKFLSTPSARRATPPEPRRDRGRSISIHALREEGDSPASVVEVVCCLISIHALREEGDAEQQDADLPAEISIHALREEGDKRAADSRRNA